MNKQSVNRAKLGAFVIVATTCLIMGLYYIGSKRNIFHSTIRVSAEFMNVGGLLPGNNVRFNGINVGTVTEVYAIADTAIRVEFTIDKNTTKFISQNSIVSIGTDGLLGNKIINISPGFEPAEPVIEGAVMKAQNPIQIDNALRTLVGTNDNLKSISDRLKHVAEKLDDNNSLWHLLADTAIAENVRQAVIHFKLTGSNTAIITGNLSKIAQDIKSGKGTIGALLVDTLFSHKLNQTIVRIESISDSMAIVSGNFVNFSKKLTNGNGAIGTLLTDTTFVHNLNQSMENINSASGSLNENMVALRYSWPFKKYFRKQKKK